MELELTVIPAGKHPGLEAYAAVRSAVVPREPVTAEEIGRSRLRRPGDVRMLARVDWHVAGCAGAIPSDAIGPGVLAEASLVALDGDRVVGFAGLLRRAADPRLAEHGLTAVAPRHRGRGIAIALKRRQIAWAARHGYRELVTWTQEGNDAMQAVNRKLGYSARPAWIRLEAPLETVADALGRGT